MCKRPPEPIQEIHSHGDEASFLMAIVGDGDRQLILEHASRVYEVDPVLSQIGRGLL